MRRHAQSMGAWRQDAKWICLIRQPRLRPGPPDECRRKSPLEACAELSLTGCAGVRRHVAKLLAGDVGIRVAKVVAVQQVVELDPDGEFVFALRPKRGVLQECGIFVGITETAQSAHPLGSSSQGAISRRRCRTLEV